MVRGCGHNNGGGGVGSRGDTVDDKNISPASAHRFHTTVTPKRKMSIISSTRVCKTMAGKL